MVLEERGGGHKGQELFIHPDRFTQPQGFPYLPLSRVISQFRPPMLVSQERMIRPPLDTVIASGRDKDHYHFPLLFCGLVRAVCHDPTSSLWMQPGAEQAPALHCRKHSIFFPHQLPISCLSVSIVYASPKGKLGPLQCTVISEVAMENSPGVKSARDGARACY